jgi:hypothetical protein
MKTDLTDMPRFDLQEASNIRFSETTSTTPNFFHLVMFARECESGSQARAAGPELNSTRSITVSFTLPLRCQTMLEQ